jgi:hypothetical protein
MPPQKPDTAHFIVDSAQIFEKRHSRRYADATRSSTDVTPQEIQPPDSYQLLK